MLNCFFRCPACEGPSDSKSLPYCDFCLRSLVYSPEICSCCLAIRCWRLPDVKSPDADPADREPGELKTLTALYAMSGPGYEVLRTWKRRSSSLMDRKILGSPENHPLRFRERIERLAADRAAAVIPVPQGIRRSFRLGRSPALQIARWLGKILNIQVLEVLRHDSGGRKQSGLDLPGRLLRPVRIRAEARLFEPLLGKRVILVDDFVTTGRTLREAARACERAGAAEIHGFCLGIRPPRLYREESLRSG